MDVGRAEGVQGPHRIESRPIQAARPAESAPLAPSDRLEVSEAARLTSDAVALPALRAEHVAELRRAIESGTYVTDAKLLAALERFFRTEGF
jgi:anti-sigma28 factor (negative regulator of flagellin synthesis)